MPEIYFKNLECLCIKDVSGTCPGGGQLNATLTAQANLFASIESTTSITSDGAPLEITRTRCVSVDMDFLAQIDSKLSAILPLDIPNLTLEAEIDDDLTANYSVRQVVECDSEIINTYTDKIAGEFGDFNCQEKLYPYIDLPIDAGFGRFVGPQLQNVNLYSLIDEGVYQGVMRDRGDAMLMSDDSETYINPDTIHTEGLFQYKCGLTNMMVRPDETAFRIRVSAPITNLESKIPPLYTIYNINLNDPSGNLIVKYNDIQLRGDAGEHPNFATYSSLPEVNMADVYDWDRRCFPHMYEVSGYNLSFSVGAVALDDPFTEGYDFGFEENYIITDIFGSGDDNYLAFAGAPFSTQKGRFISPSNGFKVSAVEICNSGGFGPRREDFIPMRVAVREHGNRLERFFYPTFMPVSGFDTTIWPNFDTLWEDKNNTLQGSAYGVNNQNECGTKVLVDILRELNPKRSIVVSAIEGVTDSGKLTLRFGGCSSRVDQITDGAFNFEFDQGRKKIWWSPSGAFNVENRTRNVQEDSIFHHIESVTLKVLAKKASGALDYALDVVGYSDDKLLHVTSPQGGFLQNPSGVCLNDLVIASQGIHPLISGFYNNADNLALGGTAISEQEKYFERRGTNSGGDHYVLSQYPMVTGTEFSLYEVPLEILDDNVRFGLSRDYSASSFFEKIFLDICPLPVGAEIAYAELCVRYAPQNALNIYTQGGEKFGKAQDGRSEGALFPAPMGVYDNISTAGSGNGPISLIESIPHGFTSPPTVRSNYARRWRGVEGPVRGPYDPDQFDFGFENPVIDFPFLEGYFKFDNMDGRYVKSTPLGDGLGLVSGLFTTTPKVYHNLCWRFSSGTIFEDQLPGYSSQYTTSDWTAHSSGLVNFVGNPMYGKISDAFDRAVRVSQNSQNITFSSPVLSTPASGLSVFIRFTPDVNVSGVGYNLFQSGVLVARWDTVNNLDFALGFRNGSIIGYMQEHNGEILEVID